MPPTMYRIVSDGAGGVKAVPDGGPAGRITERQLDGLVRRAVSNGSIGTVPALELLDARLARLLLAEVVRDTFHRAGLDGLHDVKTHLESARRLADGCPEGDDTRYSDLLSTTRSIGRQTEQMVSRLPEIPFPSINLYQGFVALLHAVSPSALMALGEGLQHAALAFTTADYNPNVPLVLSAFYDRYVETIVRMVRPEWVFDPSWHTPVVVNLAEQVYETGSGDLLPILADAMQDAGCDHEGILGHLRTIPARAWFRGEWVIDSVLGKSPVNLATQIVRDQIAGQVSR